jgi:hypothetical protein
MQFKRPENSDKYYWTRHSIGKMMQYGLSAQRITRVIKGYKRIERGLADNTVAVMQPVSSRRNERGEVSWKQEIWVMYQTKNQSSKCENKNPKSYELKPSKLKIISAWKYPGVSPKKNPIPQEIMEELRSII